MSACGSRDTLQRQWELLRSIPAHGNGASVLELVSKLEAAGYFTTVRTVQRDLINLSTTFPIHCDEDSNKLKWQWMKSATLDIPNLSITDALSIKMMQAYLTPLLPGAILNALHSRFDQADHRLKTEVSLLARWPEKIRTVIPGQPLKAPIIAEKILESIQKALIQEHQIKVNYQSRYKHETTEYQLHPLALVQRGPISYLVATAFSYEDVRLYALHRLTSVEILEDEATIPDTFDIDAYIQEGALSFGSGELFVLKLRIQSDLKTTLTESPLSDDMIITPDGDKFLATATVQNTWQLKWWIRSQGAQAEILEPQSLRDEFEKSLRETLALYE